MIRHRLGSWVAPALAALVVLTASCTSSPEAGGPSSTVPSPERPGGASNTSPVTTPTGCPVTSPRPVPHRHPWRTRLFGWDSAHGQGAVWVGGLGEHGVIAVHRRSAFVDRHGRVSWKLGWWRTRPGRLVITGRRLDGDGRLTSDAGTVQEYGPKGFVASGVTFSGPGCWRVTGRIDGTALTVVTRVLIRR